MSEAEGATTAGTAPASMTGFGRQAGRTATGTWAWEVRSVNGRGLDLRLRLPPGLDALEPELRAEATRRFARGTLNATLTLDLGAATGALRINQTALSSILLAIEDIQSRLDTVPPTPEGILALRGVLEQPTSVSVEDLSADDHRALVVGFAGALDALEAARRDEGRAITAVLQGHVDRIAALVDAARQAPGRRPEVIAERLAAQVRQLVATDAGLDPARLHAEAVLIATRADIQEELDRLAAHIDAARVLLSGPGPVGRKFDFLAQEFGREANTLCAKAGDATLSALGLDLKAVVDQVREQVQNLE